MTLGRLCGSDYRCLIRGRKMGPTLGELNVSRVSWGRGLDDVSSAGVTATVGGSSDIACCRIVGDARAVRDEIEIYRSDEDGLVWAGPLTRPSYGYDQVGLEASDLAWWFDHRLIHDDHTFAAGTDLASVFDAYAADAMAPDPIGLSVVASPTGVTISEDGGRSVLASDYRIAGDELRELLRTGVDATVVGRQMLVGGEEVPATPIVSLTDSHFLGEPTVTEEGALTATRVVVRTNVEGLVGVYGGTGPEAGLGALMEAVYFESSIKDQGTADAAAKTRWELLHAPPLHVLSESAWLAPHAPVTVAQLIPGARVRVLLANLCRPVQVDFRLLAVNVEADAVDEQVRLTLQPLGTVEGGG